MPVRNTYTQPQYTAERVDMITPRGKIDSFEVNAFGGNTADGVEWDSWMRWDGTSIELDDIPTLDHTYNGGTVSTTGWYGGIDSSFENNDLHDLSNSILNTVIPSHRSFSTLSAAEERSLQAIAMPALFAPISTSLPSPSQSLLLTPSPVVTSRKTKKRKAAAINSSSLCQSRKRIHNAIEKRYRTSLNNKMSDLHACVPQLYPTFGLRINEQDSNAEADGTGHAKHGKAAILTRALAYIKHLEATTQRLGAVARVLKVRVGAFERLTMNGSISPSVLQNWNNEEEVETEKEALKDM